VKVAGEAVAGLQGSEFAPGLEQVFQIGGHAVQLARELAKLIF
jgi:hypothetical protein